MGFRKDACAISTIILFLWDFAVKNTLQLTKINIVSKFNKLGLKPRRGGITVEHQINLVPKTCRADILIDGHIISNLALILNMLVFKLRYLLA